MTIELRQETPNDYAEAENLMREAFWNVYAPGCMEHYLLHIMRSSPQFIPELAWVATEANHLVGALYAMRGKVESDLGAIHDVLTLGPLGVRPSHQRLGVGRALIEQVCHEAVRIGYRAIVLCGDPAYYAKVGFLPAERFGIRTAQNTYLPALQVRPLLENAMDNLSGRYVEDAIYNVDAKAVEHFDLAFPTKVRVSNTPTQQRFLELLAQEKPTF